MAEGQTLRAALARPSASEAEWPATVRKFAAAYAIWHELHEADLALLSLGHISATDALVAAQLLSATNQITVYYSRGFEVRARALQTNVEAAIAYFSEALHISPTINVAVLAPADWALANYRFQVPYGTP
jgi:hypothetical protein